MSLKHQYQEREWVEKVASKLRLTQCSFSESANQERYEVIEEDIQQALDTIPPHEHMRYLDMLAREFPTFISDEEAIAEDEQQQEQDYLSKEEAVEQLLKKVKQLLPGMEESTSQGLLAKYLNDLVKVQPQPTRGLTRPPLGSAHGDLFKVLSLPDDATVDFNRVSIVLAQLIKMINKYNILIDQAIREIEKQRTSSMSYHDVERRIAGYITKQSDMTIEEVTGSMDDTRRRTAALINAMRNVSNSYARKLSDRLAPSTIKGSVRKGLMGNAKAAAWDKYEELANSMTPESIEQDINSEIAHFLKDNIS